jgi:hypothetical protein
MKISYVVERAKEIEALNGSPLALVIVSANELALVGVGLLFDGLVDDQAVLFF